MTEPKPAVCHVCRKETDYGCADCRIDLGVFVAVCIKCIDAHEERCPARLAETKKRLKSVLKDLAGWVYCPACEWGRALTRGEVQALPVDPPPHTCTAALNVWALKPRIDAVLKE